MAFDSSATNLVVGGTIGGIKVFVHDRQTGTTAPVSVALNGVQSTGSIPSISGNGRWVAFSSAASNLVANDTNGYGDVFVRDLQLGVTTRVSVNTGGGQANGASGQAVAISDDGRYVTFASDATNLVADDTNGRRDVFVHDTVTVTTRRANVSSTGEQANGATGHPSISNDGRWVAFYSLASNLVADDTNGHWDTFVHDLQTGDTFRVPGPAGEATGTDDYHPAISADGGRVAFATLGALVADDTNNEVDIYVHDRQAGQTVRVSVATNGSQTSRRSNQPTLSADGRWVGFFSFASNLVPGDTNGERDVFVHDMVARVTRRVSIGQAGTEGNGTSLSPAVSADGRWIAFESFASNLVAGDTNGTYDVFVHDRGLTTGVEPPTGLVVDSVRGRLVTVRFTPSLSGPGPTGYVLKGGVAPGQVLAALPTGHTAPVFTFLAPIGSFHIRMHALAGGDESGPSNEVPLHVGVAVPPSAPTRLTGMVNGSSVALAWKHTFHGGAASDTLLDVSGSLTTTLSLGPTESFSFSAVPGGTYTFRVRSANGGGASLASDAVTLGFPGACSGVPEAPDNVLAYRVGATIFAMWDPPAHGPAPTQYVVTVTGAFAGAFATTARTISGGVAPGTYGLSVRAVNPCGAGPATPELVVTMP